MDRLAIRNAAANALALVLGCSIGAGDNPTRDEEPEWDSIKHVEIVFSIEDAFKVRFNDDELPALDSLDGIVACLEKHLQQRD